MSGAPSRVFVARLAGLAVFDPLGDQVGRVRDVVAVFRPGKPHARVVGLVVEVPGRRRVFVPMTRVTTFKPIGPSRRAIGPADLNVSHMISAVSPQTTVMIERSRGVVNEVACTTTVVIVPAPSVPGIATPTESGRASI